MARTRTVYLVRGSEDGTIAVYGSARLAVRHALAYVTESTDKPLKIADERVLIHRLRESDRVDVESTDYYRISATVEAWDVRPYK